MPATRLPVPFDGTTWREFCRRMETREGLDVQLKDPNDLSTVTWRCDHTHDKARKIMKAMGFTPDQIDEAVFCFEQCGGYCDCEIMFNVTTTWGGAC